MPRVFVRVQPSHPGQLGEEDIKKVAPLLKAAIEDPNVKIGVFSNEIYSSSDEDDVTMVYGNHPMVEQRIALTADAFELYDSSNIKNGRQGELLLLAKDHLLIPFQADFITEGQGLHESGPDEDQDVNGLYFYGEVNGQQPWIEWHPVTGEITIHDVDASFYNGKVLEMVFYFEARAICG